MTVLLLIFPALLGILGYLMIKERHKEKAKNRAILPEGHFYRDELIKFANYVLFSRRALHVFVWTINFCVVNGSFAFFYFYQFLPWVLILMSIVVIGLAKYSKGGINEVLDIIDQIKAKTDHHVFVPSDPAINVELTLAPSNSITIVEWESVK